MVVYQNMSSNIDSNLFENTFKDSTDNTSKPLNLTDKDIKKIINAIGENKLTHRFKGNPKLESYFNGSKKRCVKIMNLKYAISIGEIDGLDGLLGALEFARIHKIEMASELVFPKTKEDYIRWLSYILKC